MGQPVVQYNQQISKLFQKEKKTNIEAVSFAFIPFDSIQFVHLNMHIVQANSLPEYSL